MTGVDRRPLQFWGEFNEWARYIRESFGRKPTVREIKEWYNLNAVAVWPDPETRPTLLDAKRHAKGIRAKGAIAEYFRQYRLRKGRSKNQTTHRRKGKPRRKPANSDAEGDAPDDAAGGAPQASRPHRNRSKPSRYRSALARAGSDTSDFYSDSDGADEDEHDDEDDNEDDGDDDGDDVLHQDQRAAPEQPAHASEWPQHEEERNEAEEAAVCAACPGAGAAAAMFDPIPRSRARAPAPATRGVKRGTPRWKHEHDEPADDNEGQDAERGWVAERLGGEHEQVGGAPLPLWLPDSHWQDHEPQRGGPQPTDLIRQHPLEPPLLLHAQYAQPAVLSATAHPQVPPPLPVPEAVEATGQGGGCTAGAEAAGLSSGPKDLMQELIMAAAEATRTGPSQLGAVGDAAAWAAAEALFLARALRAPPPSRPQPQQPRPLRRRAPPSHVADGAGAGGDAPVLGCAATVPLAAPANPPLGDMAAALTGMDPVGLRDEPYAHALLGLMGTGAAAGFGLHGFDPMAQLLCFCAGGDPGAGLTMTYGSGPVAPRGSGPGLGNSNASRAEPAKAGRAGAAPGPRRQRQASPSAAQPNAAASSSWLPPMTTAPSSDALAPAAKHSPSPIKACEGAGESSRHASAAAALRRQGEERQEKDGGRQEKDGGRQEKDGDGSVFLSGAGGPPGLRIAEATETAAAAAAATAPELEPTTAGRVAEIGSHTDADVDAAAASCGPAGHGVVVRSAPRPSLRPLAPIPGSASPDEADSGDDPPAGPAHVSTAQPRPSTTAAAAAATANTAGNTATDTTTNTSVSGAELPAAAAAAAEAADMKADAPRAISRKRPAAAVAADDAVGTLGRAGEAAAVPAAGLVGSAYLMDAAAAAARDGLSVTAGPARTSAGGAGGQESNPAAEDGGLDAAIATIATTAAAAAERPRKARRTASPTSAAGHPEAAATVGNTTPTAAARRNPNPSPNPQPDSHSKPDPGSDGGDLREEDFPLTGLPSVFRMVSCSSLRSGGVSLDRGLGAAAAAGGLQTKLTSLTFTRGRWRGRNRRRSAADWPEEVLDDPLDGDLPLEEEKGEEEDVDGDMAGGGRGGVGYEQQQEAPGFGGPSDVGSRRGGGGGSSMQEGVCRGGAARPASEAAVVGSQGGNDGQARWAPAPYPPIDHHGGGLRPYGLMPMLGLQAQELPRLPLARQQYSPPGAGLALAGAGAIGSNPLTVADLAMLVDWHLAAQGNGLVLGEQRPPPAFALDPYAAQGFPGAYPGYLNLVALNSAFSGLGAVGPFRMSNGAFGPHR